MLGVCTSVSFGLTKSKTFLVGLIYSFNVHLLHAHHVPGTVLSGGCAPGRWDVFGVQGVNPSLFDAVLQGKDIIKQQLTSGV